MSVFGSPAWERTEAPRVEFAASPGRYMGADVREADEDDAWLIDPRIERHVFVSAHFDDVALSCGGTVAMLARAGAAPIIAVAFAAAPLTDAALTDFALAHNTLWGMAGDARLSNVGRRGEERDAAALLGASVITLPFADAIYRGDRYQGNEQLFGAVHADDAALPRTIAAALSGAIGSLIGARCYVPMAVGRHVDHQLAFLAGCVLAQTGVDIWCYEDVPYSLRRDALHARRTELDSATGTLRACAVDAVWPVRIDAVMAHRSQLTSAFGFVGVRPTRSAIDAALDRFARCGDVRRERFRALVAADREPRATGAICIR